MGLGCGDDADRTVLPVSLILDTESLERMQQIRISANEHDTTRCMEITHALAPLLSNGNAVIYNKTRLLPSTKAPPLRFRAQDNHGGGRTRSKRATRNVDVKFDPAHRASRLILESSLTYAYWALGTKGRGGRLANRRRLGVSLVLLGQPTAKWRNNL